MASIESLTFELPECALKDQSETHRKWMSSAGTAYYLKFDRSPPSWTFDLTQPKAAAEFYRKQCADNGGAMLTLDVIEVAQAEALRGLFKYRAPVASSRAMYYIGILWLPFQKCCFQWNIEAMEIGPTGAREAAVMLIERDKWPKSNAEPIVVNSAEEYERLASSAPVLKLPSDEERYDPTFPDHPLSQVRKRMTDVVKTMKLNVNGGPYPPFRIRKGWKFW